MSKTLIVGAEENILNENSVTFEERKKELESIEKSEKAAREREKRIDYKSFYITNKEYREHVDSLIAKSPIAYRILNFLLHHMDNYNAVLCSYRVLQEGLDISESSVARNVKLLKDRGFIAVIKSGTSNAYIINPKIYWNSWANNMKYCKFPANIIAAASEQEKQVQFEVEKLREVTIKTDDK